MSDSLHAPPPSVAFYNNPQIRGYLFQVLAFIAIFTLFYWMYDNARTNIENQRIATGYKFLNNIAGFDISQKLISYTETDSYWRAFVVSVLNTLIVAAVGIVLATLLGFGVGIARLSKNYMISKLAYWYIEIIRNLPLLFQLIFWYLVLVNILPNPRNSINPVSGVFLNQRGLYMPDPNFESGFVFVLLTLCVAIFAAIMWKRRAAAKQTATGEIIPVLWPCVAMLVTLPLLTFFALGKPITLDMPQLSGFNIRGGMSVVPEFVALLLGLVTYTGGFIAELVRSGIQSVNQGQTEAGRAVGLSEGKILRFIVVPQAMRVIIPPLTSQFLNLTKNSSLATAIGYPDLVAVGQTILNQSGQAIEIIAMWMAVYLTISLTTSLFMNWYNGRIALVER